jgi:23S rRNA (adenine2503-C2)-methyltransferase
MFTKKISIDGTIKFKFDEGYSLVIIPSINDKNAVCLSVQVGCLVGCRFCKAGRFIRNLSYDEIINQFRIAKKFLGKNPSSVIFMGMGEPMLNFKSVLAVIHSINSEGISYNKITLSTVGVNLSLLLEVPFQVAVSLHSPFDEARRRLIPNSCVSIIDLLSFIKMYSLNRKHGAMIEYALIEGINDSNEDIEGLFNLDLPKNIFFNLIEFNDYESFKKSSRLLFFKKKLLDAGYKCFIRSSRGKDIEASCGMLSCN